MCMFWIVCIVYTPKSIKEEKIYNFKLRMFNVYFINRRRQANLQKGKQLLREGKLSEARECFTRSVNITPSMAHDVIKVRPFYLISVNNY